MIKIYNTLSKKKENFEPILSKQVGLYACGPTVYDFAHIGNLRTYIFEDILRRILEFNGYKVKHIENITDVEDKTIRRSCEEKISLDKLTAKYEKAFLTDLEKLNIEKANLYPHATDNIAEMQKLIQKLLDKDLAYLSDDGSIYFSIRKFKNYGKFANLDLKGLKPSARIKTDNYEKEGIGDFVLWKAWQSSDGPNFWSPEFKIKNLKFKIAVLKGRPGWHIECSAMSSKYLGQPFDIHAGAVDLIFPHHQNEIAQSEGANRVKMVNYWLHGEHLLVSGHKMAKSANNYYTLSDIEKKGIEPLAFRYLCLETHYRSKLNFTWESLQAAQNTLNHIRELKYRQSKKVTRQQGNKKTEGQKNKETEEQIVKTLNNDLDTPKALSILHKANNYNLWLKFDSVLGLKLKVHKVIKLSNKIKKLIQDRELARNQKNFALADKIRKELENEGIYIEDTPTGPKAIPILK